MVVRSRGKGTFVASRKALYSVDDQIGFTHSCFQEGKVPRTEVLSVSWIYPTRADVEFFGMDEDETILCTKRLRYVDDVPTMICLLYTSCWILSLWYAMSRCLPWMYRSGRRC